MELLAARALGMLDGDEAARIDVLLRGDPSLAEDAEALELAAAATAVALAPATGAPASLHRRLALEAEAFIAGRTATPTPTTRIRDAAVARPIPFTPRMAALGWLAAAACLVLAAIGWWPSRTTPGGPGASPVVLTQAALRGQREALLADAPDVVTLPWTDWDNPEITGVLGDVVWSDAEQRGFMRLVGLPANDPASTQYQLWIIDATRGMEQRVSGAVFDGPDGSGEWIIPFQPSVVTVNQGAAFAITIEQPGGTWVSDMTRRVAIAAR